MEQADKEWPAAEGKDVPMLVHVGVPMKSPRVCLPVTMLTHWREHAQQHVHAQNDQNHGHHDLKRLLHGGRDRHLEDDGGQSRHEQRGSVARSPEGAYQTRTKQTAISADERRNSRDMVSVSGVAEAEQKPDAQRRGQRGIRSHWRDTVTRGGPPESPPPAGHARRWRRRAVPSQRTMSTAATASRAVLHRGSASRIAVRRP